MSQIEVPSFDFELLKMCELPKNAYQGNMEAKHCFEWKKQNIAFGEC